MTSRVRILSDGDFDAWDRFIESSPGGTIYSSAAYLDTLCRFAGGRPRIAAVDLDGRIEAGIAFVEAECRWGLSVRPRSLLPYNGFVIASSASGFPSRREASRNRNLSELAEWLEARQYLSTTVRCFGWFLDTRVFSARGWRSTPTYTYIVNLRDLTRQWELVDRDLKRQIRRAESKSFSVVEDDDVETFLDFHESVNRRKAFDAYLPRAKFRSLFEILQSEGRATIFHVRDGNESAVATQLVLTGENSNCHIVAAGSDPDFNKDGVNAFLRWKSFELLSGQGYAAADLTDASLNSVSRFKSRFGGDLVTSLAVSRDGGRALKRAGFRAETVLRRMVGRI